MPNHAPASPRAGREDPFTFYLKTHPERPQAIHTKLPRTCWGLFQLSGYSYGMGHARNPDNFSRLGKTRTQGEYGYYRWQDYARPWPQLRNWIESDHCWRAPEAWPPELQGVFPDALTPLAFAVGFLPTSQPARRRGTIYKAPQNVFQGIAAWSAYAHGWRVRPSEYALMKNAAKWLFEQPGFLIWLYNPILDTIPLPTPEKYEHHGLFWQRERRIEVQDDPLGVGIRRLKNALPAHALSPDYLTALPRRPFDPFRSKKTVTLAAMAELNNRPRRRDWIDYSGRKG